MGVAVALIVLAGHAWYTAFLCDDAYITFRHVRNLLDGHGLVFNPGERVEGYSNFLWALQLAALWIAGIGPETGSLVLSAVSTVAAVGVFVRLAATSPFARPATSVLLGLLLLVTNRSFAVWSTSGLETRQFTLFVLLGVALLHGQRSRRGLVLAGVAFAFALLSRVEGMLFGALGGVWLLVEGWRTTRGARRSLEDVAWLALPQVVVAGAHLLFRLAYYRAPLPNTYYAKAGETWWEAGAVFVEGFAVEYGLIVLLPVAVVGAVARWRRGDSLHVLSALLVVPHQLLVARIGGDHFEYRMMDVLLPLLFLAVVDGVLFLGQAVGRRASGPVVAAGMAVVVLYTTAIPGLHYVATADHDNSRGRAFEFHVPLGPEHAGPLWWLPGLPQLVARHNTLRAWAAPRMVGTRLIEHRDFGIRQRERWSPYDGVDVPEGLVAVLGVMGIQPFFVKDVAFVDLYGLTDATIARMPAVHRPNDQRRLAHPRKNYGPYTKYRRNIGKVHLVVDSVDRALRGSPFALQLADDLWMPFDGHTIPDVLREHRVVATRPLRRGLEVRADRRSYTVDDVVFDFEREEPWTAPYGVSRGVRRGQARFEGVIGRSALNGWTADHHRPSITSPSFQLTSGQAIGFLLGGEKGAAVSVASPRGVVQRVVSTGRDLKLFVVEAPSGVDLTLAFEQPAGKGGFVVDQVVRVRSLP